MNKQEQIDLFRELMAQNLEILDKKGDDYAVSEDRLSNFKKAGEAINISAELQCLSLISTKVVRLGNLLESEDIKNEPLEDSIKDLINYAFLLYCIYKEKKNKKLTNYVSR